MLDDPDLVDYTQRPTFTQTSILPRSPTMFNPRQTIRVPSAAIRDASHLLVSLDETSLRVLSKAYGTDAESCEVSATDFAQFLLDIDIGCVSKPSRTALFTALGKCQLLQNPGGL